MLKKRDVYDILIRYILMVLVALPGLFLFYFVFTPLTVFPVYWILSIFFETSLLSNNIILVNSQIPIELIKACIAGSAYYLLLVLNLSTKGIKLNKRIKLLLFSWLAFLIVNIIRIILLSFLAVSGSPTFDITHQVFWYLLSTVFVVGIWFYQVKKFKIREIPFYSDIKTLYKQPKKLKRK